MNRVKISLLKFTKVDDNNYHYFKCHKPLTVKKKKGSTLSIHLSDKPKDVAGYILTDSVRSLSSTTALIYTAQHANRLMMNCYRQAVCMCHQDLTLDKQKTWNKGVLLFILLRSLNFTAEGDKPAPLSSTRGEWRRMDTDWCLCTSLFLNIAHHFHVRNILYCTVSTF